MFTVTRHTVVLCFRHGNGSFSSWAAKVKNMPLLGHDCKVVKEHLPFACALSTHIYTLIGKSQIFFLPVSDLFLTSQFMHVLWP